MRATGQSVFTVWCGHHSKNKKLIPNVHHFVYTINTTNALCVCGCLSNWQEYWSQNRWTTRCTKLLDLNATAPIGNCIDLCEIARPPDKIQSQYMCCAPPNKSVCIVYFRSKSLHMIMRVWRWSWCSSWCWVDCVNGSNGAKRAVWYFVWMQQQQTAHNIWVEYVCA